MLSFCDTLRILIKFQILRSGEVQISSFKHVSPSGIHISVIMEITTLIRPSATFSHPMGEGNGKGTVTQGSRFAPTLG
jgi:hypothetical protein